VVLITDGAVGNEGRLLRRIAELFPTGQGRRLFVLGVGASLDRRLVERMARAGGGASDALAPGEDASVVLERFGRRVRDGGPVLTGLSLSFEGVKPTDVYPSALPDLFGGQPVTVLGRLPSLQGGKLVLTAATADGRPFRQELALNSAHDTPGLGRLWAKRRIEALMDQIAANRSWEPRLRPQITALALEHGLVSAYTSLVAEDSEVRSEGAPVRVDLPTPTAGADEEATGESLLSDDWAPGGMAAPMPAPPHMSAAAPSPVAPRPSVARRREAEADRAAPKSAPMPAPPHMAPAPHPGPYPEPSPAKRGARGPGLIGAVGGAIAAGLTRMFGGESAPPPATPEPVGPVMNPPAPGSTLEAPDSERSSSRARAESSISCSWWTRRARWAATSIRSRRG
jgi:hypothetical protein